MTLLGQVFRARSGSAATRVISVSMQLAETCGQLGSLRAVSYRQAYSLYCAVPCNWLQEPVTWDGVSCVYNAQRNLPLVADIRRKCVFHELTCVSDPSGRRRKYMFKIP